MKEKISRSILLVVLSLVILGSICVIFLSTKIGHSLVVRNNAIRVSRNLTRSDVIRNQKKDTSFNAADTSSINFKQLINAGKYPATPIGRMSIPSVNIHNPILNGYGTKNQNLSYGVCTVLPDRYLGKENNYVLAGHYMGNYGPAILDNLHLVKLGTKIYLTDLSKIYVYRVIRKTDGVSPYDVSVEDNQNDQRLITLITCSDFNIKKYGFGQHRTVVQGQLVKVESATSQQLIKDELSSEIIRHNGDNHGKLMQNISLAEIEATVAILWLVTITSLLVKVWIN